MYYHLPHDQQIKILFCGGFIFASKRTFHSFIQQRSKTSMIHFLQKIEQQLRSVTLVFTVCLEIVLMSLGGEIHGPTLQFQKQKFSTSQETIIDSWERQKQQLKWKFKENEYFHFWAICHPQLTFLGSDDSRAVTTLGMWVLISVDTVSLVWTFSREFTGQSQT